MNFNELQKTNEELAEKYYKQDRSLNQEEMVEFLDEISLFIERENRNLTDLTDYKDALVLLRKWETILHREYNVFYKKNFK